MKLQKLTKIVFYLSLMGWFPFMWLVLIFGDSSELVRVSLFLSGFLICLTSGYGMTSILSNVDLFKSVEEYNEEKYKFIEARKKLEQKITEITLKN
jgi:hypothetical protein